MFSMLLKSYSVFSFKTFFKVDILFTVMCSFPLLYSGPLAVRSQNKYDSLTWSCGREPETINSRDDNGVKHSAALWCYFKVRFTLLLIKAGLTHNEMYDIICMKQILLCDSNGYTNAFTLSYKFTQLSLVLYYHRKNVVK